jgi:hypothetical protein
MGCFSRDSKRLLHAQFREAAAAYRLIDDAQTSLIVPYDESGKALIRALETLPDDVEPWRLRDFDRRAQRYVVGVYEQGLRTLVANGVLLERHGRVYLGNEGAYDPGIGLRFDMLGLDDRRCIA